MNNPIWTIFHKEMKRSRAASVRSIYSQVARLPKHQQRDAVCELIRAILELQERPCTHTTVVLRRGYLQ